MTREEAIAYLEDPFPLSNSLSIERRLELHDKALRMAIEALKAQETYQDAISRQGAIDEIRNDKIDSYTIKCMTALGNGNEALTVNMTCDRHIELLKNLPSAEPERKTGYWIDDGIVGYGALMIEYHGVKCDQCGWSTSLLIPRNFCPNCGAYMKGEEEE